MNFKYQPTTLDELLKAIEKEVFEVQGTFEEPNWEADLNCIDTSFVKLMSFLFCNFREFNGDISKWNIKSVIDMGKMCCGGKFNGDIGGWKNNRMKIQLEKLVKRKFINDVIDKFIGTFPDNFSTFVFLKNNNLLSYYNELFAEPVYNFAKLPKKFNL